MTQEEFETKYNKTQKDFELMSQEDQSLWLYINDNVNDAFVDEITKDELINLLLARSFL